MAFVTGDYSKSDAIAEMAIKWAQERRDIVQVSHGSVRHLVARDRSCYGRRVPRPDGNCCDHDQELGELAIDEQLFDKIQLDKQHLLRYLLNPPPSAASEAYNLRKRLHSQLLPQHPGHLMDSNVTSTPRRSHGLKLHYSHAVQLFCDDYACTSTVTLHHCSC